MSPIPANSRPGWVAVAGAITKLGSVRIVLVIQAHCRDLHAVVFISRSDVGDACSACSHSPCMRLLGRSRLRVSACDTGTRIVEPSTQTRTASQPHPSMPSLPHSSRRHATRCGHVLALPLPCLVVADANRCPRVLQHMSRRVVFFRQPWTSAVSRSSQADESRYVSPIAMNRSL
jgi:hypothetical protein